MDSGGPMRGECGRKRRGCSKITAGESQRLKTDRTAWWWKPRRKRKVEAKLSLAFRAYGTRNWVRSLTEREALLVGFQAGGVSSSLSSTAMLWGLSEFANHIT